MEICLNISSVRKTILKGLLKANKIDKFNEWCTKEGMDPIEVRQALGISSASTSVESVDPSESIEKAQLQEDSYTTVAEYLNNVDSTRIIKEVSTDIIKYCLIDFEINGKNIRPIMKRGADLNQHINTYKQDKLQVLVNFLRSAGHTINDFGISEAGLSKQARQAFKIF